MINVTFQKSSELQSGDPREFVDVTLGLAHVPRLGEFVTVQTQVEGELLRIEGWVRNVEWSFHGKRHLARVLLGHRLPTT